MGAGDRECRRWECRRFSLGISRRKLPTRRFSVFNHGALNRSASEKSKHIKHFRDYDGADKDRFFRSLSIGRSSLDQAGVESDRFSRPFVLCRILPSGAEEWPLAPGSEPLLWSDHVSPGWRNVVAGWRSKCPMGRTRKGGTMRPPPPRRCLWFGRRHHSHCPNLYRRKRLLRPPAERHEQCRQGLLHTHSR